MDTLAGTRDRIAEVLSSIEDLNVRARVAPKTPRLGDGWVTIGRIVPADFTMSRVTYVVVITLGADAAAADLFFEEIAVDVVDVVTKSDGLYTTDVALEPVTLVTEGGGTVHALTLTLTTDVEAE